MELIKDMLIFIAGSTLGIVSILFIQGASYENNELNYGEKKQDY